LLGSWAVQDNFKETTFGPRLGSPPGQDDTAEKPEPSKKKNRRFRINKGGINMRINHNMTAIFANRQLQKAETRYDKSLEKLSSGEEINRAGDDASGLAVSEKMRTQINGLRMAEKNAMSGLSFIQVAEGSFQQLSDILQRVRALSVQAANGIYSNQDRQMIQLEVSQLIDEIDRISTSAQFNNMKMLTGRFAKGSRTGSMFFHVGPNRDQRIRVYISSVGSKPMHLRDSGGAKRGISSVGKANSMIGYVDDALLGLNRQRADLGAYYNRMENTARALTETYENMMSADSRIRDTDMAAVMVEFTKDKILLQTGSAMLAQANLKRQPLTETC